MKTIVIAHPDDEAIFAWPALKTARRIVAVVSDQNRKEKYRSGCRIRALKEACKLIGVEAVCLGRDTFFPRTPELQAEIESHIEWPVFTHNPWGEYNHQDHIAVHKIIKATGRTFYMTDINCKPGKQRPPGEPVQEAEIDIVLFEALREIYRKHNAWTWSKEPVRKTTVYKVKGAA